MHLLIIRLGSIGDIVHTLPALAAIKEAMPRLEVSWAVERRMAELLRDNPMVHRLIEIDTRRLRRARAWRGGVWSPMAQLRDLRDGYYDVALDFQGLMKSAAVALASGAPRRYGFAPEDLREPASRWLMTDAVEIPPRAHVVVKNLTLAARALDIPVPTDPRRFQFPITTTSAHDAEAEIARRHLNPTTPASDFAILNPGGGWATKLWDANRFGRLADELWSNFRLRSIVTHGPGEESLAAQVVAASRGTHAQAACLSLRGFFALARTARIYVGGDTGPTHLAVAAGAPVVGLFGPTEWWFNGSPRPDDICVERTDIACRINCNRRTCGKWVCLDIEVGRVLAAVDERLRRADNLASSKRTLAVVG